MNDDIHKQDNKISLIAIIILLMSIFLVQSQVIFGINMSISDFFSCLLILVLIFNRYLVIPKSELLFFLLLSISLLSTSFILVPLILNFNPNLSHVIRDYLKLLILFIYFLIGYNLNKLNYIKSFIKWYSTATLGIAVLGIIYTIINISIFRDTLFFDGNRFRGLMNDPNYFSVLQLAGLIYFVRRKNIDKTYRIIAVLIIIASIVLSGSKTGLLSLLMYTCIYLLDTLRSKKKSNKEIFNITIKMLFGFLLLVIIILLSNYIIPYISKVIPGSDRILLLFTDFKRAISGGGSSRNMVWELAINLFIRLPISGVGVGTYIDLGNYLYGIGALAHNTYLQIICEWGIVLAIIFFTYIIKHIIKIIMASKKKLELVIANDILIVFLIGSLGISLNNSRLFWISLGIIIAWVEERKYAYKYNSIGV